MLQALAEQRAEVWGEMDELVQKGAESWDEAATKRYGELESEYRSLSDRMDAVQRHIERSRPAPNPLGDGLPAGGEPETEARAEAFDRYLRGRGLSAEHRAILSGQGSEQRDQNEGTPADGGYLVPAEFRQKLVEVRKAFGGLAAACDGFSTSSGNPITYPVLDDTGNEAGITAEAASFTGGADLDFGEVSLGAYKFTTLGAGDKPLKVSVELAQDSAFNVADLIARAFGRRIARRQAKAWTMGSGSGEPKGLLGGASTTPDVGSIDNVSDLTYPVILSIEGALDPEYTANAKWLMNNKTWIAIRAITDAAGGRPLVLPSAVAGMGEGVPKILLGYPVVIDQSVPDPAADKLSIAFGDFVEAYVIRTVGALSVIVNPYSSASQGQIEYVAWERADGTIQNRNAYVTAGDAV